MAAQLELLRCPVDELPERLYRVQYEGTKTGFMTIGDDAGKYYLRAKNTTAFRDEATFSLKQFKMSVERNLNWRSRKLSTFINLFSNLHHAANWCLQKVENRNEDAMIMFIDPVKLVNQGVWLAKLSTVCKHLAIDLDTTKACGDRDAYLILHQVPATAIVSGRLVSKIIITQDVDYGTELKKDVIDGENNQPDGRLQLDQLTREVSSEGPGTELPNEQHTTESEEDESSDEFMSDGNGDDGSDQDEEMSTTEPSEEDGSDDYISHNQSDAENREHGNAMQEDDSDTSMDANISELGRTITEGDTQDSASIVYPDSDSDLESGPDEDAEADLLDVIAFMREKGMSAMQEPE